MTGVHTRNVGNDRLRPRYNEAPVSARMAIHCLIVCFCAVCSAAQQPTTGISGRVMDPSGAVIANAKVSVSNASGAARTIATDAAGGYAIRPLAPGVYVVSVQAAGFATGKKTVNLGAPSNVVLNFKLAVSSAQTQVEVRAQSMRVSVSPTENATSLSISGSQLNSLSDDPDTLLTQIEEMAGPSTGPSAAEVYIDGFLGGDLPPKAAIREIKVNQNPFSAEYDRLGYGRVEILTKPGNNTLHGGGFVEGNSSVFNAESPFLAGSGQPPYHSLLYGGRLGGPLGKKASFFLAVERRNINRDNLVNTETLNSSFQPALFISAIPNPRILTSVSPRVDYQLSPNNTLSARYHFFGTNQENEGVGSQYLPSQAYTFTRSHHLLQISDTQVLSPRMINQTRFQYLHFHNMSTPQDVSPTLEVLGAFTGGGYSDGSLDRSESHYELQNLTTINFAEHYFRFGGFVRDIRRTEKANPNFNGTFIFNSLSDYAATQQDLSQGMTMAQIQAAGLGPSQFDITRGGLLASVNRLDGSLWLQDDWRIKPRFTLSYGGRFESENVISDHADFAPRLGFSWGLGPRGQVNTVVRAGFGIFYKRFDDDEMIIAQRLNGINQTGYVVYNPLFFPTIPSGGLSGAGTGIPTAYRISPDLKSPYAIDSAASIEHQLTRNATVSITYLNSRGDRQLLTNDVNAPLPGTYDPADPSSGLRPLGASAGNVYEYVSNGIYRQNQIIANFRVSTNWLGLSGYYVYNDVKSDTAGVDTFAENPWNVLADYGPAEFDIRHRLFLAGSFTLPFGIEAYPMVMARSGMPFSITIGQDLFGTGIHNARPAYASSSTSPANLRVTPYGSFDVNPSPTATPVPPNTATGPAAFTFDLRLSRTFGFGESGKRSHGAAAGEEPGGDHHHRRGLGGRGLADVASDFNGRGTERRYAMTFSVDAQDLFNDVNLGIPVGDLNSPLFGQSIDLANSPYSGHGDTTRRIDLRLAFDF